MSIDFDSAALQTQQEEEEYDQEDYAREQEVILTCQEQEHVWDFSKVWLSVQSRLLVRPLKEGCDWSHLSRGLV